MVAPASLPFVVAEAAFLVPLLRDLAREDVVLAWEVRPPEEARFLEDRPPEERPALPERLDLEERVLREEEVMPMLSRIMFGIMAPTSRPKPKPMAPSNMGLLSAAC
jgi:hypothetical protein